MKRQFEQVLVAQCAPTLWGLKPASLFRYQSGENENLQQAISRSAAELYGEKITLKLRNTSQDTVTFVLKTDNTLQMRLDFKDVHNRNVMEGLARVVQTVLQQNGITIDQVSFV